MIRYKVTKILIFTLVDEFNIEVQFIKNIVKIKIHGVLKLIFYKVIYYFFSCIL